MVTAALAYGAAIPVIIGGSGGGSGAPTTAGYVTVGTDPNLTGERVISGTAPITVTVGASTLTLSATDASTTAKGVAQFDSTSFSSASGTISIKTGGITAAMLSTAITTDDIVEGTTNKYQQANTFITTTNTLDDIADGSTYKKSHNDFTDTYKGYLGQEVKSTSSPTFANVTLTGTPGNNNAVTKAYVDGAITGLSWKNAVLSRVTDSAQVETASAGDRYLINGTGATAFLLHDNAIAESAATGWVFTEAAQGDAVYSNGDQAQFTFTGTQWVQLSASVSGSYVEGNGINITGTTVSVDYDNSSIGIAGGKLAVKASGITAAMIGALKTDDLTEGDTNKYYPGDETTQDLVGAMLTGNTETGITVTYQDADGTIDFVVPTATVSAIGLASFADANFDVSAGGEVTIDDIYLKNSGDTGTGVFDFGGATSFEIVNATSPTVNAAGEIAIDTDGDATNVTQGMLTYFDGTRQMYGVATDAIPTGDGYVLTYNATSKKYTFAAPAASSGGGEGTSSGSSSVYVAIPLISYPNPTTPNATTTWRVYGITEGWYDFSKNTKVKSARVVYVYKPNYTNSSVQWGLYFSDAPFASVQNVTPVTGTITTANNSYAYSMDSVDIDTGILPTTAKYITPCVKGSRTVAVYTYSVTLYLELTGADGANGATLAAGVITETMLAEDSVDETSLTDSAKDCGVDICFGGDSTTIESSITRDVVVPFNCSILSCSIYSDSGSVQFDIWKDTDANFPPTNDDSIVASANPAITAGTKYKDSTLTGWTKDLDKGDIIRVVVDSVATMTRATLHLQLRRR